MQDPEAISKLKSSLDEVATTSAAVEATNTDGDDIRISPDGSSPSPSLGSQAGDGSIRSSLGEVNEKDKIKSELQKKKEALLKEDETEMPRWVLVIVWEMSSCFNINIFTKLTIELSMIRR